MKPFTFRKWIEAEINQDADIMKTLKGSLHLNERKEWDIRILVSEKVQVSSERETTMTEK